MEDRGMISFTANHSDADLERWIQEDMQEWFDELLAAFREQGREFVDNARAKTKAQYGFNNITWDLRSSIGMVLECDGEIIETYFPKLPDGDGYEIGKELADSIIKSMAGSKGINMVIVAGMDYARYVESKGWDVISGSGLMFSHDLTTLLR